MGKQYKTLTDNDRTFIETAKLFFIASCSNHEVNLSPKGYDTLQILDDHTLLYLDYPGSGNRTARDIREDGDVTLMWCAFEGKPNIVRCFCKGELIDLGDTAFEDCLSHFKDTDATGIRRFIRFHVYAVESSCGMSIPIMQFQEERHTLREWAIGMESKGTLEAYLEKRDTPPTL